MRADQQLTLRYNEISTTELERDDFDEWSLAGDQWSDKSATARYVSQEMTGYEELERHGDWRVHEEYGPVWYPRNLSPGWAPYRHGSWAHIAPWGWTWVDLAPWGYAPSHYGRWLQVGSRWCWVPGPRTARPVWAPALVGWVTTRRSGEVVASNNIGWFPLSPGDVYQPVYQVSNGYVYKINHGHVPPRVLDGYTGHAKHSGHSGHSGPSGHSGYSNHNGHSGHSGHTGHTGHTGRPGHSQPPANVGNHSPGFRQGDILYRYQNRGEAVTVMAKDPFGNNRLIQVPSQPSIRRTVVEPPNPRVIPITPGQAPANFGHVPVTQGAATTATVPTIPPAPYVHNQPQPPAPTAPGIGRRSATEPGSAPRNDAHLHVLPTAPVQITPVPAANNVGTRPIPGEPTPENWVRQPRHSTTGNAHQPGTRRTVVEPANPHVIPLHTQPAPPAAQPINSPVAPQVTLRPVITEPERPHAQQPPLPANANFRNHAGGANNPHVIPIRPQPPATPSTTGPHCRATCYRTGCSSGAACRTSGSSTGCRSGCWSSPGTAPPGRATQS